MISYREHIKFNMPQDLMTIMEKEEIGGICGEHIDEVLFEKYGSDMHTWYDVSELFHKYERNPMNADYTFYYIIQVSFKEGAYEELQKLKERLESGL